MRISRIPLINSKGEAQGLLGTFTRVEGVGENDSTLFDPVPNQSGILGESWGAYSLLQAYFSSEAGSPSWNSLEELFAATRNTREIYQAKDLIDLRVLASLEVTSPSLRVIRELQARRLNLTELEWRVFEELVAELLNLDGYEVKLQSGRKDGGADILAYKEVHPIGRVFSIWQAKQLPKGKVRVGVVRELADSRQQFGASKGMIVTSSFLTKDALDRVEKDRYTLGKIDRSDLMTWVDSLRM